MRVQAEKSTEKNSSNLGYKQDRSLDYPQRTKAGYVDNRASTKSNLTIQKAAKLNSSSRLNSIQKKIAKSPGLNSGISVIQMVAIDLTDAELIKPGPPATLKSGGYFYKVFNSKEQADAIKTKWDQADSNGVITPDHKVVSVTRSGSKWAFRSKGVAGTFFQFSKGGHTKKVTDWIATQTSTRYLGRLRNIFAHVRTNIGDGQGFFQDSDGGNIWFIDVNTNGTTPNSEDVVTAIDIKITELNSV